MKSIAGEIVLYVYFLIFGLRIMWSNRRYLRSIPKERRVDAYRILLKNEFLRTFYGEDSNERSNQ